MRGMLRFALAVDCWWRHGKTASAARLQAQGRGARHTTATGGENPFQVIHNRGGRRGAGAWFLAGGAGFEFLAGGAREGKNRAAHFQSIVLRGVRSTGRPACMLTGKKKKKTLTSGGAFHTNRRAGKAGGGNFDRNPPDARQRRKRACGGRSHGGGGHGTTGGDPTHDSRRQATNRHRRLYLQLAVEAGDKIYFGWRRFLKKNRFVSPLRRIRRGCNLI